MAKKAKDEESSMPATGKHTGIHEFLKDKISAEDLDKVHSMIAGHGAAEDEHEEDEEIDKESEEFHGGEAEDAYDDDEQEGHPGEKLKELGAETGEDEEYDAPGGGSEPSQEQRDNAQEWRRGEKRDRPATDKKRGAKDARRARDHGPSFGAKDQPPKFKGRPMPGGSMDRGRGRAHDSRDLVTREEMENGIAAAVKVVREKETQLKMGFDKAVKDVQKKERDIREAERAVAPYVGSINMSFDSAEAVYAHALRMLNIDVRGVHPSAYPSILKATRQSLQQGNRPKVAMDYARTKDYYDRFPDARRIRVS